MMFQSTLIAALLAVATADISSTSNAGAKLLSKARSLNQNNAEDDMSWMAKYDLKFEGCHTIHTYGGEAQEGEEGSSPFGTQHLAKFKLCSSSSSCGMCSGGGTYMVPLGDFAQAYLEAEQQKQEALCQAVEENCNCQYYNGDDESCMANCYKKAGYDFCGEEENEFNVEEYMQCAEAPFNNNNGYYGYNANQYYIGPTCSGSSVYLAVFTDAACTKKAPSNTYENKTGGYKLPYSSKSMISTKCVSCKQEDENQGDDANANANQYYEEPEPSDTCTQLYEQSAKCETNLSAKYKSYRDTGSCDYIHKIVPALERVYVSKGGGGTAGGFAVFFGLTTIGFAGAAYYFYSKVERSTVNLSDSEGGNFA